MTGLKIAPGLDLPIDMVTEPIGIMANRGRGKTYATHALVEEIHDAGVPVVILDVKGDWWGVRSSADGKSEGMPFYIFGGDHADLPLEATAGELLADLVVDERVSVVLDLSHLSKTKARSFTTALAERLYHRNRDPLFLVVDEADVLIPQRATAETARLLGAMEDLAKRGRGRGIGMAVVTQRPQEVAKSVLDLMETLLLFGMTGPRQLDRVKEWISVHVDETHSPAEVMASLPNLQVGQCWVWSPMRDTLKRVSIRQLRTFDSHPTPKVGETRRTPKTRAVLDLGALGERIAATAERAKADDPRELHKRIRDLEQQLGAKPAPVEIPVMTLEQWISFYDAVTAVRAAVDSIETRLNPYVTATTKLPTEEQSGSDPTASVSPVRHPAAKPAPDRDRGGRERGRSDAAGSSTTRSSAGVDEAPAGDRPDLKAGARKILDTLGRHHPMRVTRGQLGALSGFKVTGGAFQAHWRNLKRADLVDDAGDIGLTEAGLAYLGVEIREPMTTAEVLDQWQAALKPAAWDILNALVGQHPDGLTRDQLAFEVDMTASGGAFQGYVRTLQRNNLVESRGSSLYAADTLFLGAAS